MNWAEPQFFHADHRLAVNRGYFRPLVAYRNESLASKSKLTFDLNIQVPAAEDSGTLPILLSVEPDSESLLAHLEDWKMIRAKVVER
jgi:hypothetical protein